jgi:hypothetical protein
LAVFIFLGLAPLSANAQQVNLNIPGNAAIAGTAVGWSHHLQSMTEVPFAAQAAINNVIGTGIPGVGTFLDVHHFIFSGGDDEDPLGAPFYLDVTLPETLNLTTLQAYVCEGSDNGFPDADRTVSAVEFFVDQGSGFVPVGSLSTVDTDDYGCFDRVELTGSWAGVSAVRYGFTPTDGVTPPRVAEVTAISPDWGPLFLSSGIELIQEGGTFKENNLALGATPFAFDVLGNGAYDAHQIVHLNDGVYGNSNSWIGDVAPPGGAYVGLALPALTEIGSIAFGRDNLGQFGDRWQGEYTVQYTTSSMPEYAGEGEWTTIGTIKYNTAQAPRFAAPSRRHQYTFDPVQATGVRLLVPEAGMGGGTCIDEIELYASGEVLNGYEITGGITLVEEGGSMGSGNVAAASDGSLPFAIDSLTGYDAHSIPHINDGKYGNDYSWIGVATSETLGQGFVGVNFGEACEITSIAFGRDNTGGFYDLRILGTYRLQYTTSADPNEFTPDSEWIDLGTVTYNAWGGEHFSNPALRHRYEFDAVTATGVRVIVPYVQNTGNGTCIDELEVYGVRGGGAGLEGDLNGDGVVSSADLDLVRANWGQSVSPGNGMQGDGNGDGIVNSADLDIVRANWGRTAAAAAVPEPGTFALLLGALVVSLVARRK